MNWERAKTLLIVLLFVVNLFLGGIFLYRENQGRTLERRAMEDLCAILAQNGLIADPGMIPHTLALTYDIERSFDEETASEAQPVRGLPVWGLTSGSTHRGPSFVPVTGNWLWSGALPIDNNFCFSAGYSLLKLTETWEETGFLEQCELGFAVSAVTPDVIRLRPCWRFVISGEEYFVRADA